jgi:FdhD protein
MKTYEIIKVKNGRSETVEDSVVNEISLSVDINKKELVSLLCSPQNLKELVIGYLYSNGIIYRVSDIRNIKIFQIAGERWSAQVEQIINAKDKSKLKKIQHTGCGKGIQLIQENDFPAGVITSNTRLKYSLITELMKRFQKKSEIFLKTGGVHSSAIVKNGRIISFMEDIGRHNTIDKVIGHLLLKKTGEPVFTDKAILTSGRISSEILQKILRCEIPILISRSAPTDIAIETCRRKNITLVGFARGNKLNIYSGSRRIDMT